MKIWQKIRQNHLLLMAVCCLVPIILIAGFLSLYKRNGNDWIWLMILLCPLMHVLMMRGHWEHNQSYQCPECGFKYKEKEWAEKCGALAQGT